MKIKKQIIFDLIKLKDYNLICKILLYIINKIYKLTSSNIIYNFLINNPTNIHLLITTKCNRRCTGCVYSDLLNKKKGDKYLSLENLNKILESNLFDNPIWVSVKGGEPLMHKELPEIIRRIKEKKAFVSLTTNADLFTQDILIKLNDVGLNWINISHYNDNASKIKEIVFWAKNGLYDINRISISKHSLDCNEIINTCDFTYNIGIKHFYFGPFDEYLSNNIDILMLKKNNEDLNFIYKKIKLKYNLDIEMIPENAHSYLLERNVLPYCYNGISYINIAPDLSIAPCCVIEPEKKWGDINNYETSLRFKKCLHNGNIPEICKRCSFLLKR